MSTSNMIQLKQEIANSYPDFEVNATRAWNEIIRELATVTDEIVATGPDYLPSVDYKDLNVLGHDKLAEIRRKGTVIIRNVVPREEAEQYKQSLKEFVAANPNVEGTPANNPQYFQIFYTKAQVAARSHPNFLSTTTWLNKLYSGNVEGEEVDLEAPLTYVDRFRMRQPGVAWGAHPPHIDGGSIERWQDSTFRTCFDAIFKGDWRSHNPYSLKGRLGAKTSAKGLANQASIFRTFQGWLAVSRAGPQEGTLKVFPDITLSTAYIMLRPFFTCLVAPTDPDMLDAKNWKFDLSTDVFHGVSNDSNAGSAGAARPFEFSEATHPHMRLEQCMLSVPTVYPGDTVFWQADVCHAVEKEHNGTNDASVMYIPAVPSCRQNLQYVRAQADNFAKGCPPPDFPQGRTEHDYKLYATQKDIHPAGLAAMGLPIKA